MNAAAAALKVCKITSGYHSSLLSNKYPPADAGTNYIVNGTINININIIRRRSKKDFKVMRASHVDGQEIESSRSERRSFLTLEEAGIVEMSGLSSHEAFLCRLTVCIFT